MIYSPIIEWACKFFLAVRDSFLPFWTEEWKGLPTSKRIQTILAMAGGLTWGIIISFVLLRWMNNHGAIGELVGLLVAVICFLILYLLNRKGKIAKP